MATLNELNLCSVCNKTQATSICAACKKYFCRKDFKEHVQQLSIKFDNEIVRSHDELLEQIQKLEKSNYLSLDLFDQIEQWKKATVKKVEKAAEKAHHELIELIDKQRLIMTKQLEPITREIRYLRKEANFAEDDINRLKQKINEIQQKVKQFIEKDTNKTIIIDNNQIDWNHLIYIRETQSKYSSSNSIGEVQELFVQDLSDQEHVHQHTDKLKNELAKTKNESKKSQKIVPTQQRNLMAQDSHYHKCSTCEHAFSSNAYLQAHIHRRHSNCE
ncbi:unnamed protein product [Rotaria sp. Silwood2]|nr:unnamed protein product [Rotaria sp. Silwood2]CAF4314292.1 unnamed protein product [Rotaria sp. Silwood2]CAF4327007.1 unnamed protein product [Rotaria sp. Silwood2]